MNKKLFILSLGISLILLMGDIPRIFAQESATDEFMLEEITVTAEKRATNLQKTPVSIQTVAGDDLITEAKQRIDDIMQGVVGVSSQGSQVGTDFYMRGLGTADYGPPVGGVTQSAVAVLIDGVYQNRGEVVRGGTLDMAQAEVLRGTQSTTLGGSSLAGAVSLVSNDPVFNYEGSGSLGFGDYKLLTFQGVLNVPLADNQAVRLAFSSEKRDGYLSSNAGNSDMRNARIKYRWQPTETFDIIATINHQDIGGNGVNTGVLTYSGSWEGYDWTKDTAKGCTSGCYDATMGDPKMFGHLPGESYEDRDNPWDDGYPADRWPNNPFRHTTIDQYSADINWDLGIGTLTVTPSYQKAHFRSQEPPRGNSYRAEDQKQETLQVDTQLTSAADAPFEWLAGLYYYDTTYSNLMPSVSLNGSGPPGPPGGPCSPNPEVSSVTWCYGNTDPNLQTTYAAYGNMSYPVLDNLTLNAGVRYTHDMKSTRRASDLPGTPEGPTGTWVFGDTQEGTWKAVTYRVGGQYDMTDKVMLYAMYATGYQPGTIVFGGANEKQSLEQITAGVKSRLLENRLQINLEGFNSTYHDRPMQGALSYFSPNYYALTGRNACGSGGGPDATPYTFDNDLGYACYSSQSPTVPDMTSMGADLEINWLLTENDRVDASAEYLQSQQGKPRMPVTQSDLEGYGMSTALATDTYNALVSLASQYDGLTLQNSPEWSANVSYSHSFNFSSGSTLTPKVNMEYRDAYWSQGGGPGANIVMPGDSVQKAYTLWNAYLNWVSSDGKFNVNAYVKNIQNKPIKTNLGSEPDPNAPKYVTLAAPRTLGLVFSVKW
jgi:iron complex outermembrane receptor protein